MPDNVLRGNPECMCVLSHQLLGLWGALAAQCGEGEGEGEGCVCQQCPAGEEPTKVRDTTHNLPPKLHPQPTAATINMRAPHSLEFI